MYIISVMIFTFSIRDFGHPEFLKSQCGHPFNMNILAKSLHWGVGGLLLCWHCEESRLMVTILNLCPRRWIERFCHFPQKVKIENSLWTFLHGHKGGFQETTGEGGWILFRWQYEESSLMVVAVPVGAAVQD